MLTLYWFWSANPQKARLALEELGLGYSLVTVDLAQGGQYTDLVGELNPNRKVPIQRPCGPSPSNTPARFTPWGSATIETG